MISGLALRVFVISSKCRPVKKWLKPVLVSGQSLSKFKRKVSSCNQRLLCMGFCLWAKALYAQKPPPSRGVGRYRVSDDEDPKGPERPLLSSARGRVRTLYALHSRPLVQALYALHVLVLESTLCGLDSIRAGRTPRTGRTTVRAPGKIYTNHIYIYHTAPTCACT